LLARPTTKNKLPFHIIFEVEELVPMIDVEILLKAAPLFVDLPKRGLLPPATQMPDPLVANSFQIEVEPGKPVDCDQLAPLSKERQSNPPEAPVCAKETPAPPPT
jgi:hypothetical protein